MAVYLLKSVKNQRTIDDEQRNVLKLVETNRRPTPSQHTSKRTEFERGE
jgi:hypothetical protein